MNTIQADRIAIIFFLSRSSWPSWL